MKAFLAALFVLWAISAQAEEVQAGMPFVPARKILLAQRWKPVNVHKTDEYKYIGVEHDLIRSRIYEVESCSIDRPYCIFNYSRKLQCLRIVAAGEQVVDMKVFAITSDCPKPKSSESQSSKTTK